MPIVVIVTIIAIDITFNYFHNNNCNRCNNCDRRNHCDRRDNCDRSKTVLCCNSRDLRHSLSCDINVVFGTHLLEGADSCSSSSSEEAVSIFPANHAAEIRTRLSVHIDKEYV